VPFKSVFVLGSFARFWRNGLGVRLFLSQVYEDTRRTPHHHPSFLPFVHPPINVPPRRSSRPPVRILAFPYEEGYLNMRPQLFQSRYPPRGPSADPFSYSTTLCGTLLLYTAINFLSSFVLFFTVHSLDLRFILFVLHSMSQPVFFPSQVTFEPVAWVRQQRKPGCSHDGPPPARPITLWIVPL